MRKSAIKLEDAEFIEFHPVFLSPENNEEKLAALCGYLTGDGTICTKRDKYVKKDGTVIRFSGAFYSKNIDDIEAIASELSSLNIPHSKVGVKKTLAKYEDGYQTQIGGAVCKMFIELGVPYGKKVDIEFLVPKWILEGTLGIKRAYLSALFGAEGSSPAKDNSTKSRKPRTIHMTMCKVRPTSGTEYFSQLVEMMKECGVDCKFVIESEFRFGKMYDNYRIKIPCSENINFFENIGYTYSYSKSLLGWKWLKYLKAYEHKAKTRRDVIDNVISGNLSSKEACDALNLEHGAISRMTSCVRAGKTIRAGNTFPHYKEWIEERWDDEKKLLRLKIQSKSVREKKESVFNIQVSSSDHSYILANGANNFNSFESMSGRVYHTFDRKLHVGNFALNPKLPIYIGQDFNIDPMSSVVLQIQPNGEVWAIDEIVLFSSNTLETCEELERKYWRYVKQIIIYPDPAGGARQHARGETDLDIFREKGFKKIKYRKKHPRIADRVNSVNKMLLTANGEIRLRVDAKCKHLITSLEQTAYKDGGREIDKSLSVEHSSDALGYFIELEFPSRKIEIAGVSI